MNEDQMKGKWGKLTDDDLDQIEGRGDILAGKIQELYGKTKEAAQKEVEAWRDSQNDPGAV